MSAAAGERVGLYVSTTARRFRVQAYRMGWYGGRGACLVVQDAVTTWRAYNRWGGRSLYVGPDGSLETRSRVVSFDRPCAAEQGAGDFLGNELALVRLVFGLDVTYWTDIDLDRHPERLLAHRAVVSLGHDEYWSTRMRRGAEAGRARRVNLAFLGANAVYRHIRLRPSPTGPDREEVNPESRLLGAEYECNPTRAAGVVVQPSSWLFAGTRVRAGSRLPGWSATSTTGSGPGVPRPPRVEVLLHSPVRCRGASFADTLPDAPRAHPPAPTAGRVAVARPRQSLPPLAASG